MQIHLEQWAANNGVSKRTAQAWAKDRRIPAMKKAITKTIVKKWYGYVIDEEAEKPSVK
jgi:predicted site-specific integrase-resolvase